MNYSKKSVQMHKRKRGKIEIKSKIKIKNKHDLSIAYTPGVAEVCRLIQKDQDAVNTHTYRGNTIAVVTDGSAVLGLGNIGPKAAMPVMEGKALLFKEFGGVDAIPIVLDTQDQDEIIDVIKKLSPSFAGINLEDISAPRCFYIEQRLIKGLDIPVFHDDQHGTAIVVLASLINALKVVKKELGEIKIVINGAGSAAIAIANLLIKAGVNGKKMIILDSKGTLNLNRKDLNDFKLDLAKRTNRKKIEGDLEKAIKDADVFIGVSKADVLKKEWVESMNDNPIVFAMANPNPEISYKEAKKTKIAVFGTGRSDYPNQINNVLVFPGVFRGAIDNKVKQITDHMKIKVAYAIANLIKKKELNKNYIIPNPLDKRVVKVVARAIKNST